MIKATHSRKWGRPSPFPNSFLVRFGCLKERDQRQGREQDREGMVENGRVNSAQRRSLSPSDLKFARFADHFIRAKRVIRTRDSLVPPHLGPERRRAPVHHPGRAQSMPASRGVVPKENMGSVRLLDAGCIAIAEGMT